MLMAAIGPPNVIAFILYTAYNHGKLLLQALCTGMQSLTAWMQNSIRDNIMDALACHYHNA